MQQVRFHKQILLAALLLTLICVGSGQAFGQGMFSLSRHADFSTEDLLFSRGDILYMKVVAPEIDFTVIEKNIFKLKADSGGDVFEGHFTNLLDGSYVASIDLSTADLSQANWEWEARIRDEAGQEFRAEVDVQIVDPGTPVGDFVEIQGFIRSLGADFLVVAGATIQVDASTSVIDKAKTAIQFSDLQNGDLVKIRAVRDDQGALLAFWIKLENRGTSPTGEVELTGLIESLGNDRLTVFGKVFVVSAQTEILDDDNNPISFSALNVGDLVDVKADRQSDGSLQARRIRLDGPDDHEVELTGTVDGLTDVSISVDGVAFQVKSSTSVFDENGASISFAELNVGMIVAVRADIIAAEQFSATDIMIIDRNDDFGNEELELTGEVSEVTETQLTVAGFVFTVNATTVLVDNQDVAITLAEIRQRAVVEVRADVLPDGSLLATHIKLEDNFMDEVEVTGLIEDTDENALTVHGFVFQVTANTVILDKDKRPIAFGDLQMDMVVEVRADVAADGALIATKIKIEDLFEDEVELTGTIESLGPDSLVVTGITFFIDANTVIFNDRDIPIAFAQLLVGELVEIRGHVEPGNRIIAMKIKLEDRISDEIELRGVVEGLSGNTITVLGKTLAVTENTTVFDQNQDIISFGDLFIGQVVEARGDQQSDGTFIAIRIEIETNGGSEVAVTGAVDSVNTNFIRVVGIDFQVDGNTEIVDERNNGMAFADLHVGMTVEVRANAQAGINLTTRIKVEDVTLLSGKLDNVFGNGIQVFGKRILVDGLTMILGRFNRPLALEDLKAGQVVQVRIQQGAGDLFFATKVRLQEPKHTTSVHTVDDGGGTVPEGFFLSQNYPNPFNPETTISFRVPEEAGLVKTKVSIYNLLGQRVAVLIDAPMTPGLHRVIWNGRDDRNRTLASGVYLYRLASGMVVETRRMLLLK